MMMRNAFMLTALTVVSAEKATYLSVLKATHEPTFTDNDLPGVQIPTCGSAVFDYREGAPICRTPGGKDWCYIPAPDKTVTKTDGEVCPVEPPFTSNAEGISISSGSKASSSMRDTRLYNNMRGWKDIKNAQFLQFPATLEWRRALVPSVRTKAGFNMQLHCALGGAGGLCDQFVFVYSCPPCQFANGGDDFVPSLLNMGFAPHRCQTVFDLDRFEDSALHNVVIYHKQTPVGEMDEIVNSELLEFVWYATSPATTYCAAYENEEDCSNADPMECTWRDDSCHHHLCPKPRRQQGPWPSVKKCQICPFDPTEAPYIPDLLV